MAIFDGNLPYSNLHELNLDWIVKKVKENKTKIDELRVDLDSAQAELDGLLFLGDLFSVNGNTLTLTGKSLTAPNGFVGNLSGNASSATTAQSANTANSAQHALRADTATTAGSATTAQRATTADTATNATHATTADTALTLSGGQVGGAMVYFSQVATQDWYGVSANNNDLWLKKYEDSANKWHFQILIYRPDLVGSTQKWMSLININITDGTIGN